MTPKAAPQALARLRALGANLGVTGAAIPSWDAYRSESPPARNRLLQAVTGFSGSFGIGWVEADRLFLITDGRYLLQAAAECPPGTEIVNSAETPLKALIARRCRETGQAVRFLVDGACWTREELEAIERAAPGSAPLLAEEDLYAVCWPERPAADDTEIFLHSERYAGLSAAAKLERVREVMQADVYAEPLPEHVAWALNMRAWDTPHTPAPFGRLLVFKAAGATWFCDRPERVNAEARAALAEAGVALRSETELAETLRALPPETTVQADPKALSAALSAAVAHLGLQPCASLCALPQATKNEAEFRGAVDAHRIDGAAVTRALFALERAVEAGEALSETQIVDLFLNERRKHPDFVRESFSTIAGINGNGAVIHYRPEEATAARLTRDSMVLIDSGGQYPFGTTDITRTVCLFAPTEEQRRVNTLVLKGHIALARAVFPAGTTGGALDVLARQFLRHEGKDYAHGTGHGVGAFLGVHEGPQRISARGGDVALVPGMILSNEPGYYREGAFGIRIENLMAVEARPRGENGAELLGFHTLTLAPYDFRLTDFGLLDAGEKAWLAAYHERVLAACMPALQEEDDRARLRKAAAMFGAKV